MRKVDINKEKIKKNSNMVISIGSDHAGFQLKAEVIKYLTDNGFTVIDYGTDSDQSVDYPDYAHAVVNCMLDGESHLSILICGTGNGICMTANKWLDVRAALCWNSEIAQLARQHNNANILCMPARFISTEEALKTVKIFLETEFEGGRHEKRTKKINPNF